MKSQLTNAAKFCLVIILSGISFFVKAQQTEKLLSKIYVQASGGSCTHSGDNAEWGLQGVIKNKWSITLSSHDINMKPKNLPSDYQPGYGFVLFLPYEDNPRVNSKIYSISAGRFFPSGRNTWFSTEAGVSVVNGEKMSFKKIPVTSYDLLFASGTTSNYETTTEKKSTIGGMLRADVNWAFASFMGLGAGVFANFNSVQSSLGFQIKIMAGMMGRKKKNRNY